MNDQDVFDLEAEDVTPEAWGASVSEIYAQAFDSCGTDCDCECDECDVYRE